MFWIDVKKPWNHAIGLFKEIRNEFKRLEYSMKGLDLYQKAHLLVAAIRILEYQHHSPPAVEAVCRLLDISVEEGGFFFRKFEETGILKAVESPQGIRLAVRDHSKIEEIPRGISESLLDKELKNFQTARKGFTQKIESFQAAQAEKKKQMFAELEKKLKIGMEKK